MCENYGTSKYIWIKEPPSSDILDRESDKLQLQQFYCAEPQDKGLALEKMKEVDYGRLTTRERQTLWLIYHQGQTCRQAAATLGISHPRVVKLRRSAICRIKRQLGLPK